MWSADTLHAAVDRLQAHVEAAATGPVLDRRSLPEVIAAVRPLDPGGDPLALLERYLAHTVRLQAPGALAHQVAVPATASALADLVHGALNQPVGIWEMGSAGVAAEVEAVRWLLRLVGWDPAHSGGVLTHGGSLANLTALLAARARVAPDAWEDGVPDDLVILAPAGAHYSIARAASILGLGRRALVELECDPLGRIRPDRIAAAVDAVRAAGQRPMALVALACATSTGLHDDLEAVADAAEAAGVWLHVDGAHGASALLSAAHRPRLAGIERADSLIWDAHKLLRVSGLCAAVLVRDDADLAAAFQQDASYLFDDRPHAGPDLLERSVECTKTALGFKLLLTVAELGEDGLGAYVAGRYEATARFAARIAARPGWTVAFQPEANICCFRGPGDPVEVRDRLAGDGRFHLSTVRLADGWWLRMAVMSPATDEATIDALLDSVEALEAADGFDG